MRFSAAAPKGCMVARYRREAAACSHSSRSACADLPLAEPPVTSISMAFPPVSQNLVWSYVSGWYASIPASSKLGMPSYAASTRSIIATAATAPVPSPRRMPALMNGV